MKRLISILSLLAFTVLARAQTTNGPVATNAPTIQSGAQSIVDAFKAGMTNWYFVPYGLYAPALPKHVGGGLAAIYPLSQYVVTGLRVDYVNGDFWMPSGNATFQIPLELFRWLTVTPFGYAGVGVPVSGAKVGDLTIPGAARNNNGQATAILGYGGSISIWSDANSATKYWIDSVSLVADRETWTGFAGQQYRFGLAFNVKLR